MYKWANYHIIYHSCRISMNINNEKYLLRSIVAGHMCRRNIGNFSNEEKLHLETLCAQEKTRTYYDSRGSQWAEPTASGMERLYELNSLCRKYAGDTIKEASLKIEPEASDNSQPLFNLD